MKNKHLRQIMFLILTVLSFGAIAQNRKVLGKIAERGGQGIPGASVIIKGSTTGTTTNANGEFSVNVKDDNAILMISSVGFISQEVKVGSQSAVNLTLSEDVANLSEVIVTGYGSQAKKDITGAVATISAKDLQAIPATTFAQQMQGRASGLSVVNDATPGGEATIRIRGFGTIGNNDPLYVIDGVPTESQGNLNPMDIESIQILKDASSASIYGSRAANGVVIITTKQGKPGEVKVNFSTYQGSQTTAENVQALNAKELGQYLFLADKYAGKTPSHGQYTFGANGEVSVPDYVFPSAGKEGTAAVDPKLYSLTPGNIYAITKAADTNWWNELTQTAPIRNFQVTATGGVENGRFALSLGYFNQESVVKFVGYERYTLRANTEFTALKKRLKIGENFSASLDNRKGGFGNNQEQNAVSGSYKHHPLLPVYDIAGNFAGSRGANLGNNSNPYATLAREADNFNYRLRAFGNVYAEYAILPDLKVKTSLGIDINANRGRYIGRANPEYIEGSFNNGSTSNNAYFFAWTWTNTLSYSKTFNKDHKFDAYVGLESIKEYGEGFSASRGGYAFESNPIISYLDLGDATRSSNSGNVFRDYTLYSQFGKLNYAYKDKYLFQAILRNDQSSRFLQASRNAIFPAFSLGWRMSEEGFIKNQLPAIDDLKLRFGYGQTGNQKIGDYNAYTTYRADIYHAGYPIDGSSNSPRIGYDTQAYGNPKAKWETTTSTNFGIDASLFKSKLAIEIDVWNRKTTDMLYRVQNTFTAGDASEASFNVGAMTNAGVDIGVNYRNSLANGIRYSVGANYGTYRNTVDKLDESPSTKFFGYGSRVPAVTITQAGLPISSFYGYKVLGIFQSDEEARAWAPYADGYNKAGKFKMEDVNKDGKINDDDRTIIGNPHPDFIYGLALSLGYKAFDLNVFATGTVGNDVFNYTRYFSDFNTFQGNRSKRALYEAWQPTNKGGTVPIMDANDQVSSRPSSYFIEKGSYLRIKNVQLTYTMPSKLANTIGFANVQAYVQVQNLATFTKYTGLNPEIQTGADNTLSFDGGYMPVSRTLLLGLNVGF